MEKKEIIKDTVAALKSTEEVVKRDVSKVQKTPRGKERK